MAEATDKEVGERPEESSLASQLASTFAADAISFVSAIAFSVIITRALAPEGKGLFSSVMSATVIAASLASFGLPKALIYHVGKATRPRGTIIGTAVSVIPLMAAIGTLGVVALAPDLPRSDRLAALAVAAVIVASDLVAGVLLASLRAVRQIGAVNLATVLHAVSQLALVGLAWMVSELEYKLVLLTVVGAWSVRIAFLFGRLRRVEELRSGWKLDFQTLGLLLKFGLLYQLFALCWSLHTKIDVVLLQRWIGSESAGIYATGANLAQTMWRLSAVVSFVTIPYMTQMKVSRDSSEFTALSCRLMLPLVAGTGLVLFVASNWLVVLLYGEPFRFSADPFRIIMPGVCLSVLYNVLGTWFLSRNILKPMLLFAFIGAALNLALNAVLIPAHAEGGAALASTISYSMMFLASLVYIAHRERMHLATFLIPTRRDARALVRRLGRRP